MQKTLTYQNILSRRQHINPAKKEVLHISSRIASHKFIRLGNKKRIGKICSFGGGVSGGRLQKKISVKFRRAEEAYYHSKQRAQRSAKLPYSFVEPNPRDHARHLRPIFRRLLTRRCKQQLSKYRRERAPLRSFTSFYKNLKDKKNLSRKFGVGTKLRLVKKTKRKTQRKDILVLKRLKKPARKTRRVGKIKKHIGRAIRQSKLKWRRLQRRGFTRKMLKQKRAQRLRLRSLLYAKAYFFKTVRRE